MLNKYSGIWISDKVWKYDDLTVIEKLFLVKITGLDGEKGCYASNQYFSNFFKLSKSRCSSIINSLKSKGYIVIHYAYEGTTKVIERRVIKVKNIVAIAVKNARNIIKRKGGCNMQVKAISKGLNNKNLKIQNLSDAKKETQIECLELVGTSINDETSRIRRTMRRSLRDEFNVGTDLDEESNLDKSSGTSELSETKELEIARVKIDETTAKIISKSNELNKKKETEDTEVRKDINEPKGRSKTIETNIVVNRDIISRNSSSNIIYEDIINYLNIKSTKSFRINTVKTLKFINARLREGYTVDDFKKVIDKKCAEWLNTCMENYLRPETLFGTKFERAEREIF